MTPLYLWDLSYDGVSGFRTNIQARVSDEGIRQGETPVKTSGTQPRKTTDPRATGAPSAPSEKGQSGREEPSQTPTGGRYYHPSGTPTGRPLPMLREIHQTNLRKILEEEGMSPPCDICGNLCESARTCTCGDQFNQTADALRERCQNCTEDHVGQCPCG